MTGHLGSRRIGVLLWNYSAQGANILLSLLKVAALTRLLDVREYGVLAEFLATKMLLSMALAMNLGHGFLRFASAAPRPEKAAYGWTIIAAQSCLHVAILPVILLPSVMGLTRWEVLQRAPLAMMLLVTSALSVAQTQLRNQFIADGRAADFARANIVNQLLLVAGAALGAWLGGSTVHAVAGMAGGILGGTLLVYFQIGSYFRVPRIRRDLLGPLLGFSIPLLPVSISYWGITSGNRLVISYYLGSESLGRFAVVSAIPAMIMLSYTVLSSIFLAGLSRLYERGKHQEVGCWLVSVYRLYAVFSIALACAGFVCSRTLLRWMAGESYLFEGVEWVFLLAGLGSVVFGLLQISSRMYDLERMIWRSSATWVGVSVLSIGVNVYIVPRFGLLGCVAVNLASLLMGCVIIRLQRFRHLNPQFPDGPIVALSILAVVLATAANRFVAPAEGMRQVLLGGVVFVGIVAISWGLRVVRWDSVSRIVR